jgi:putative addiction module component (TIGR02574 family)
VQSKSIYDASMSKTEIREELPKLTKTERQKIRLRLAKIVSDDWLDDEEPLTIQEKALLEARLVAYAKNPDAGSTWEEVERRIRARLSYQPNG